MADETAPTLDELTGRACAALGIGRERGGPILGALLLCEDIALARARRSVLAALAGRVPPDVWVAVEEALAPAFPYREVPRGARDTRGTGQVGRSARPDHHAA